MKIKQFPLLMLVFLFFTQGFAQQSDSVFVEFHSDKGRIVRHTVQPGETVYSLARAYGTSNRAIQHFNPSIKRNQRRPFQQLFIPLHEQAIAYRIPLFRSKRKMKPLYYRVKPKDNIFRISKVYFKIPTALLVSRNGLEGHAISIGQVLHIGWLKSKDDDLQITDGQKIEDPTVLIEMEFFDQAEEIEFQDKKTISLNDQNSNTPGMFVLHDFAKKGSIIQVLNPMLGTIAYGKVLGQVPKNLYSEEIEMIISNEMAKKLGVMDSRVFLSTKFVE